MHSPIHWFGGKGDKVGKILPIIKNIPHKIYVEPFGGGASVLLAKRPSPIEIYNDIDSGLSDFFLVLSNPKDFDSFYRRVITLPYSREIFNIFRKEWIHEKERIERVAKWFVVARQSFSGCFDTSWSFSVSQSRRGMAQVVSGWLSCLEGLPKVHQRLQRVQIEHDDWLKILDRYDSKKTLFYLDPPYILSTRKGMVYAHEMTDKQHKELVRRIKKIEGKVVLSGYEHKIYQSLQQQGWKKMQWNVSCNATAKTKITKAIGKGGLKQHQRIECLWISPNLGDKKEGFFN